MSVQEIPDKGDNLLATATALVAPLPEVLMSATQIMYEQQRLAPKTDLSDYSGKWILIREGAEIVASGDDPAALRRDPAAREEDVLILVPPEGTTTLVS
jgi:hypothetical protein